MKATCPKCSTAYKVADEKVPASGAQIKCPKCETVFVVHREPAAASSAPPPAGPAPAPGLRPPSAPRVSLPPPPPRIPPPPSAPPPAAAPPAPAAGPAHAQATPLDDLTALFGDVEIPPKAAAPVLPAAAPPVTAPPAAAPPAPAPSALTPGINALDGEAVVQALREELRAGEGGRGQARGVSAIRAQTGSGQGARGPAKADFLESFRVRTSRGLTYDFPNAPSLERWLGERDDLASCEVSLPGEDWTPAAEFLDRARSAAPRPPRAEVEVQPSQPLVGLGERAPLPRVERREHGLPPLRPRAGPAAWSLLVLSYLLLLAGLAVTVTRYGVWDLSPYLPLEQVGVLPPERLAPQPAPAEGLPERPAAVDPAKAFGQAMQAAREAMAEKRFSRAAMEFNRALAARPGAPEALEGLARAYHGLGDAERARAVAKKAQEIKHR